MKATYLRPRMIGDSAVIQLWEDWKSSEGLPSKTENEVHRGQGSSKGLE